MSYRSGGQLQSHYFQASDAFNKQQWINCIRQAKEAAALTGDQPPQTGPRPLSEAAVSLQSDSGIEDEKSACWEMETGPGVERTEAARIRLVGNNKLDGETKLSGEAEPEPGVSETGAEAGVEADGRAGNAPSRGASQVPTFLICSASPTQEEVMEQERSGVEGEEELSMDTSDSFQSEELSLRC